MKNLKDKLNQFIVERRAGIMTLRNHKMYGSQTKKSKMLREERADGQEWIIDELERILKEKG